MKTDKKQLEIMLNNNFNGLLELILCFKIDGKIESLQLKQFPVAIDFLRMGFRSFLLEYSKLSKKEQNCLLNNIK